MDVTIKGVCGTEIEALVEDAEGFCGPLHLTCWATAEEPATRTYPGAMAEIEVTEARVEYYHDGNHVSRTAQIDLDEITGEILGEILDKAILYMKDDVWEDYR